MPPKTKSEKVREMYHQIFKGCDIPKYAFFGEEILTKFGLGPEDSDGREGAEFKFYYPKESDEK